MTKNYNIEKFWNLLLGILIFLAVLASIPNTIRILQKRHPELFNPETHISTYVGNIIDENGNDRCFLEVEYWENANHKGQRVLEIRFNSYTDPTSSHVIKRGVQFNLDGTQNIYTCDKINYEKDGNASWKAVNEIDTNTNMYVKIDDEAFSLCMDGTYVEYSYNFNFAKGFVNFFKWGFANEKYRLDINNKEFAHTRTETVRNYTMDDFYKYLFNVVDTNAGYGENILSLVDLANFFSIKRQDKSGAFIDVELGQESQAEYFSIHTTKHREGLIRAKDSDFGMYFGDGEFTLVETDTWFDDFTNIVDNIILTERDFNYKYCSEYDGCVAVLKDSIKSMFTQNMEVEINFDISNINFVNQNYNIIGILYDFAKISKITLTFNTNTYPLFYEFYDESVGRQYLPTNSTYSVFNKANEYIGIVNFPEVAI